ncbi:hypothetical protein GPECTOR_21g607 [Gonium pectorale]|uniref:Pherophorin domain-containing protein n=1 Tax=Gonium pectorale TaxID=33097 RepID=A0A150GHQ5_GONPE|nr:hypothetical protein GPECTOR_21g607 [Gonium pectorale]|eukprot:KXZ49381.1 hypothetical protein GPECTOR_21g607 [Gonium pectorale]
MQPPAGTATAPVIFDQGKCEALVNTAFVFFLNWAASQDLAITSPLSLKQCSGAYDPATVPPTLPRFQACGAFQAPQRGLQTLERWLNDPVAMQAWILLLAGPFGVCTRELAGYTLTASLTDGRGGAAPCVRGSFAQECPGPQPALPVAARASPPPPALPCPLVASGLGSAISTRFALRTCSGTFNPSTVPPTYPFVKICGAFQTPADALMVQPFVSSPDGLERWLSLATGGGNCPANLRGHTLRAYIADENGAPSTCLQGSIIKTCP